MPSVGPAMAADHPLDTAALVVSTSRLFHNYRHTSNALLMYDALRRLGVPDRKIVLMLAGSVPCDARNALRPSMFGTASREVDLLPCNAQVDVRQDEVTVDAMLRILSGRHAATEMGAARRLHAGPRTRLILYMTGHGGDGFLKFNDQFELAANELAAAAHAAFALGRFSELLLLIDTC